MNHARRQRFEGGSAKETVAEFVYRPNACRKSYRLIVVRKDLSVEKGQQVLFADYRYFFYITNDRTNCAADIVFRANDRCNQENLHAQLKHGVCALDAPVDNLVSNWAYMVMRSLAWNLKAWLARRLAERKPARCQWHTIVIDEMEVLLAEPLMPEPDYNDEYPW
jgi:hypothetical protein